MVSKARRKGNVNRRKTVTMLEEDGYKVAIIERTGRFIFPKDAFGLFDLLAIKPCKPVRLIQVSTNKPHSHTELKKFAIEMSPCRKEHSHFITEQWTWYDRKGLKRWEY